MMKSKVTTEPTEEPITLAETKKFLNVTDTAQDSLLTELIKEARQWAERITGRKFINQTLIGYVDGFTGESEQWWTGTRRGTINSHVSSLHGFIPLDWAPCDSVTLVETIDIDNTETTYAATNYYLDNFDEDLYPRIYLNQGATTPSSLRARNAIKVTYVAGYGAARTSVPHDVKTALKKTVSHLFYNRGDCEDCANDSAIISHLKRFIIKTV